VQNGVGIVGVLSQRLYRFSGRKNQQFDLAPRGFTLHLVHHWKSAVSAGANDQAVALPRYFLPDRKWGMTEGVADLLGRLLLPLADVSPSITTSCSWVTPSIRIEPNQNSLSRILTSFFRQFEGLRSSWHLRRITIASSEELAQPSVFFWKGPPDDNVPLRLC
jgi:hypothetical protein